MATTPRTMADRHIDYPTSDGKPMAETEIHARGMMDLIESLRDHFAAEPDLCISGNLLLFHERGNKRKHIVPDVFVVRGVAKLPPRKHYLLWEEGKGPDAVIELTSKTTRAEDQKKKLALYRDVLKVPEYLLFDPFEDYLRPSMQGYQLVDGQYEPIERVAGRLPNAALGLHLERDGTELRLFDPATGRRLLTPREQAAEARAENERLRQEVDALRRQGVAGDSP